MNLSKPILISCLIILSLSLALGFLSSTNTGNNFLLATEALAENVFSKLFEVKEIEIKGNVRISSQELLDQINNSQPLYFWKLTNQQIKKMLLENPWLENLSVDWQVSPLKINITITETKPWLVVEYRGGSWLVGRSGKLIQPLDQIKDPDLVVELSELPRLDGISGASEVEDARLDYAIRLIDLIDQVGKLPFVVERYTLIDQGIKLKPLEFNIYPEVSLSPGDLGQAREALDRLLVVLEDLKKRGEKVSSVDLRFGNQAVVK